MSSTARLGVIVATLLALTLGLSAGWIYWVGGPEGQSDGSGALASFGNPENWVGHSFDRKNGPDWAIGIELCLNPGFSSVTLDGQVRPATVVGDGLTFLGARAGVLVPASDEGALFGGGAVEGYPSHLAGAVTQSASGLSVTTPCHFNAYKDTNPVTELDFGVRAPSGTAGGGWQGIQVGYTVHGFHHWLTAGWRVYVCGSAIPAEDCPDPMPHA